MQIIEIKNNLVKISYNTAEENLVLSGFVLIKDAQQSFIAQVIHLEADVNGNSAIVKLLFNFNDEGVISSYNGSIPDIKSLLDIINPQELLEILPIQYPILMGELVPQKIPLNLDKKLFEDKLLVCSEKDTDNELLIENFAKQLEINNKKVLVIDLEGNLNISQNKLVAGKDFKLPLNYDTINFIYEGLEDAKPETKALIQEIFLEVQEYVKTLPEKFLPFESFMNVVDDEYQESGMIELVLLKNKLLKYFEQGVFAQSKDEFATLKFSLKQNDISIIDVSQMSGDIQKEIISYAYSLVHSLVEKEIYVFLNINNTNSDKKLLKKIFTTNNAYSTLICPYSYKYLKELKQLAKNLILFSPILQQSDFAGYNVFLNKLNPQEFVVYGSVTQHLPLIAKLSKLDYSQIQQQEEKFEQSIEEDTFAQESAKYQEEFISSEDFSIQENVEAQEDIQNLLDEQIRKDVDEIYMAPKSELEEESEVQTIEEEGLTEEDLDLIDDLNILGEEPSQAEAIVDEEVAIGEESDFVLPESVEQSSDIFEESGFVEPVQEAPVFNILEEQQEEESSGIEILPVRESSTPIVPIYSADVETTATSDSIDQGDIVMHPKYGKGVVEKLINYGTKTLCSINFDNVGRRLLDPSLAELKKVEE